MPEIGSDHGNIAFGATLESDRIVADEGDLLVTKSESWIKGPGLKGQTGSDNSWGPLPSCHFSAAILSLFFHFSKLFIVISYIVQ